MRVFCCLSLAAVLCTGPGSVESLQIEDGRDLNETFFISEIFDKYGDNNVMTYEGFEHLLENLGLGRLKFETKHDVSIHKVNGTFREFHDELFLHKHNHNGNQTTPGDDSGRRKRNLKTGGAPELPRRAIENLKRKCLSAQDILTAYGLKPYHEVVISPSEYLEMCPAIVYELDRKLCQGEEKEEDRGKEEERRLVWTYATLSILTMGLSGMVCVAVVPWMRRERCWWLVELLVSLGVGTLCGDALIHLIPQVFCANAQPELQAMLVSKATVALLAIYFFFIVETLLKRGKKPEASKESGTMISSEDDRHRHSHGKGDIDTIAWMAIMGDILHNVTDGLSIGAAFSASLPSGFASSIAIFCHELPHELGDYAILLSSGMSFKKALFYNVVSSAFSLLGMVVGVLLGELEDATLWINAFTAGSFLYIALSDLVPELKTMQENSKCKNFIAQSLGLGLGGVLMFAIALFENEIESLLC